MEKYDILVIGGGPGGYVAAIKAAQLGKKVACVDNKEFLGGTCLNVGCIPSKSLLNITHKYHDAKHNFASRGIECKDISFSLEKIMETKYSTLSGLGQGIAGLFKKNKIDYFNGIGEFETNNRILINSNNGDNITIEAENIIIATGSVPITLPDIEIDEEKIVTSDGALSLEKVPNKMIVIGAGVIGLELGSVWSRLGASVEVVEFADDILPGFDLDVRKEAKKIFEKQGLSFKLTSKVTSAQVIEDKVEVNISSVSSDDSEKMDCDVVLVAVGRKPNTKSLNLDKVGIKLDDRGRVIVDGQFKTNIPNIYAIGDVIAGPMLAHKASDEGVVVAEIIDGQHGHIDYNTIPSVVYTHPEIASVGKTEDELKKDQIDYKVGKFPFLANSRARTSLETDGFVKVLACKESDQVLGVHIIGDAAGELIAEAAVAMEFKAASEDLARICNPHPTLNEAIKEAALATYFKPIHL
ncbi:dihydrolipoyl dehydrogenase [Rickettsiales endosymbiont of Trichoplax sp. H2]|uniref:dihydrolipoyl dehydrogenase n=1 Tax=Rickettsiales endosymbiont of Trichoplax sp. H2 TaxID=2021221 RepID=UPI0012B26DF5|nr:dihydrolipoyl dehydrogenase [Rickettsiales endosymbiont of Trichoplax sp. H2]MSO14311.1 Dihydrolipoyl dehydrogenase, mitochondrial [Rickettsiales endosymbiont of Trichoplax sp. H2]